MTDPTGEGLVPAAATPSGQTGSADVLDPWRRERDGATDNGSQKPESSTVRRPASPVGSEIAPGTAPAAELCPYLLSADLGWRAARPSRDHRCTAVNPAVAIVQDKQRRLCLISEHEACLTYTAAEAARANLLALPGIAADVSQRRPLARTTPVLLDRPRPPFTPGPVVGDRRLGQVGLFGLMVLAFALIVIARLPASADNATATLNGSPSLAPSAVAAAAASAVPTSSQIVVPSATVAPKPTPTSIPSPTSSPSPPSPTPVPVTPTPIPTSAPTAAPPTKPPATPEPTPRWTRTYRVKSGDSLFAIAVRFHTSIKTLELLNGIKDPSKIYAGQVLKIP